MADIASALQQLHDNPTLRARFARDPGGTLRSLGVDTSGLDLPASVDPARLTKLLDDAFSGRAVAQAPSKAELSGLSAEQLWERYGQVRTVSASRRIAAGEDPIILISPVIVGPIVVVDPVVLGPLLTGPVILGPATGSSKE